MAAAAFCDQLHPGAHQESLPKNKRSCCHLGNYMRVSQKLGVKVHTLEQKIILALLATRILGAQP